MNQETIEKRKIGILVGITEDNYVIFVSCELGSCGNNHYTITHNSYAGLITAEKGEQEAKDRLSDSEYWEDSGYNIPDVIKDFVDFDKLAEDCIDLDGWENVNGEYHEIGEYEGETYFINISSCGANAVGKLKQKYKQMFITEDEKNILIESDKLHLKDISTYSKKEKELFEKVKQIMSKYGAEIYPKKIYQCDKLIPLLLEENQDDND